MDEKKQIEEMANCKSCYERFGHCYLKDRAGCSDWNRAVSQYEQGYRKIPKNAVVLTEEELKEDIDCSAVTMLCHEDGITYVEYEDYKEFTDRLGNRIRQLKGQLKQVCKEILSEIGREGCEHAYLNRDCEWFDRICKKHGVEVDE